MELYKDVDGVSVPLTESEVQELLALRAAYEAAQAAELEALRVAQLDQYMQEFRDMRRDLLNVLTGIAIAEDLQTEFKALRQVLLDIPQAGAVEQATTAAEAKQAIKLEYAKAVAQAPAAFIVAFKEMND